MASKNTQRFAEIEYCLQRYFNGNISPVMKSVRDDLTRKQCKELANHQNSAAGVLSEFAAGMSNNPFYNPMDTLKHTGKWNSKTAEDYVEMCKKNIVGNKNIQNDLVKMASEWRTTVVKEVGRAKYDQLSKSMGCDLAFAYVDYRVDQMMVDYMVKQEMPRSSVEYVLKKGSEGSLLGLASTFTKSPLQAEIDRRGEAAYKPSVAEIGASKAMSFGSDLIMTGGYSSWATVGKLAATDVVFSGVEYLLDKKAGNKEQATVEQCISQGVFGSKTNVFDSFRHKSKSIVSYENQYVLSVNNSLKNKMAIWADNPQTNDPFDLSKIKSKPTRDPNVPLIVAPGHEAEFLQYQQKQVEQQPKQIEAKQEESPQDPALQQVQTEQAEQAPTNEDGWANLLSSLGLNDLSSVGHNLGYVIAMLPDMLLGMFTGKTQSVGIKKDMLPMASIVAGMFVKNPLLKMTLIGLGGANLLNKFGHEAIERQEENDGRGTAQTTQYKQYADEPLNARITYPAINSNTLVANIDRVPCSVTLPDSAVAAYRAGALPLNTLANAVLAKSDTMQQMAQTNYQNVEMNRANDRQITLK
jgi:hypothetical protein